jgi:deoxyribodipyrimidine photo-lyase
MRILVLFTRDLRVHDHPPLAEACRTASEVVPLFVLDPVLLGASANRDRFLLESLADLDRSLERLGGRLFVRRGAVVDEAMAVASQARCSAVFMTGGASAFTRRREGRLADACERARIELRVFPENAVVEPGGLPRKNAYRVFTPYFRAWGERPVRDLVPVPRRVHVPADLPPGPRPDPASVAVDAVDAPRGGERVGRRRLHAFLGRELEGYERARDDLGVDATSRLSPYLRFGCVSATEAVARANGTAAAEAFVRQLAWRDFFLQLLAEDPALAWRNLRDPEGIADPPMPGETAFAAWREGRTGLPLVDAGMRQLVCEGWMHNRARLVVASFLTRRLGVPWQRGERHFSRLLVDADPANNAGNWQWAAGTGTDPRRARTLNPVRQARRYDPRGAYVRRYVNELRDVPAPRIFTPWVDAGLLRSTGYPEPIIPVKT